MPHLLRARTVPVVLLLAGLAGYAAGAQIDALYLADYRDGDLKVRYDQAAGESVATLPLRPDGAEVVLVFEARWRGRGRGQPPTSIEVRSYPLVRLDNPRPRPTELRFVLESGSAEPVTLAFYGSSWGAAGFTAPGQEMWVVRYGMSPEELAALALSRQISGEVMGLSFAFTGAQRERIADLTRLLRPDTP